MTYAKIVRGASRPEYIRTREVRASRKAMQISEGVTLEVNKLTQDATNSNIKGKHNFKRKKKWLRR